MKKIAIFLVLTALLSFGTGCGKKDEATGVDKTKVDYILEGKEVVAEVDESFMEGLQTVAKLGIYAMYDFDADMSTTGNIEVMNTISTEDMKEVNTEMIKFVSENYKSLSVKSVEFTDMEMYEDEEYKDYYGIIALVTLNSDLGELTDYMRIVTKMDNGILKFATLSTLDAETEE